MSYPRRVAGYALITVLAACRVRSGEATSGAQGLLGSGALAVQNASRYDGDGFSADALLCPAERVCFAPGISQLGVDGAESRFEERPARLARLPAFSLDRREVTAAQYQACVQRGHCVTVSPCDNTQRGDGGSQPMTCVQWEEARAYCVANGGRLPTEAEWERAAAGAFPEHRRFPFGGELDASVADRTPEGVEDLAGSVAEWVADFGGFYLIPRSSQASVRPDGGNNASDGMATSAAVSDASASTEAGLDNSENENADAGTEAVDAGSLVIVENPRGPRESVWRVVRGGYRGSPASRWTSTGRIFRFPTDRKSWIGFRCAYPASPDRPPVIGDASQ